MMISVVIPLYNKEQSVASTLDSVLAQTFSDFELVVVDDGSTDASADVVCRYIQRDSRIRLIRKNNGGVCSARNQGIYESKGDYVAFLDADDIWDENYLAEQERMIHDFPQAAIWSINYAETKGGKIAHKIPTGLPDGYRGYVDNYFEMSDRISDLCCSSSVVIRKDVFDKVGGFDERIRFAEDTDMWWRIIATHRFAFYDKYMAFYQLDAENRAMNKDRQLRCFLPYYVTKYQSPLFRSNQVFYNWVNRWAVCHIRNYYFGANEQGRVDAKNVAEKLDYTVIPFKYRLLFRLPFPVANIINTMDKKLHNL